MKKTLFVVLLSLAIVPGVLGLCFDFDEGNNAYSRGFVLDDTGYHFDSCAGSNLTEYYCANGSMVMASPVSCRVSCHNYVFFSFTNIYSSRNDSPVSWDHFGFNNGALIGSCTLEHGSTPNRDGGRSFSSVVSPSPPSPPPSPPPPVLGCYWNAQCSFSKWCDHGSCKQLHCGHDQHVEDHECVKDHHGRR